MCRLYGFRANEPTKVECSLVYAQNALLNQSRKDELGTTHPDGWGISYYEAGRPRVEKNPAAAFEGAAFSNMAERVFSKTVVAHVRLATYGENTLENTHPFTWDRWTFAHNGNVAGFEHFADQLAAETAKHLLSLRQGQTDSEAAFYWLLTRIGQTGINLNEPGQDAQRIGEALLEATQELAARCQQSLTTMTPRLNFMLTDGEILVASRWNRSLHWVERHGLHDCEFCGIPHVGRHKRYEGTEYRAIVVASEAITDEDWREVPEGAAVVVTGDVRCSLLEPATAFS